MHTHLHDQLWLTRLAYTTHMHMWLTRLAYITHACTHPHYRYWYQLALHVVV